MHYQYDPVQTTKTCVHGAINMLGLAKRTKARILQASTSEVYGDPEVHPQPEAYRGAVNSTGIRACYDEGKRCAETLFFDYQRQHDVDIRRPDLQYSWTADASQRRSRRIQLRGSGARGRPLTIFGDGTQTRAFCYVDDLVDGLVRLMNVEGAGSCEPVNLGNPVEMSILSLAECVIQLTGVTAAIEYRGLPADDPVQRCPDITARAHCSDGSRSSG